MSSQPLQIPVCSDTKYIMLRLHYQCRISAAVVMLPQPVSWIMNGDEHGHKCVHIALRVAGSGVGSRSGSPLWKYWPNSIGPVCALAYHHKCASPVLFSSSSPGLRPGRGSLLTSGAAGLPDGLNSSHRGGSGEAPYSGLLLTLLW